MNQPTDQAAEQVTNPAAEQPTNTAADTAASPAPNPPAETAGDQAPVKPAGKSAFAEAIKHLPGVSHLAALQLLEKDSDELVATIEHKTGQVGSLTVYNHLALTFGAITPQAANKGLELYAEHTADARANPGKHPNIDRLLKLIEEGRTLRVKHVFAT